MSPEELEKAEQIRKYVLNNWYGAFGTMVDNGKLNEGVYYLIVVLFAVAAYLLGSLNFAVIISKLKFGEDIRTKGSGNAGNGTDDPSRREVCSRKDDSTGNSKCDGQVCRRERYNIDNTSSRKKGGIEDLNDYDRRNQKNIKRII